MGTSNGKDETLEATFVAVFVAVDLAVDAKAAGLLTGLALSGLVFVAEALLALALVALFFTVVFFATFFFGAVLSVMMRPCSREQPVRRFVRFRVSSQPRRSRLGMRRRSAAAWCAAAR